MTRILPAIMGATCAALGVYLAVLIVTNIASHVTAAGGNAGFATAFALAGLALPPAASLMARRGALFPAAAAGLAAAAALYVSAGWTADAVSSDRSAHAAELEAAQRTRAGDEQALTNMRAGRAAMVFVPADAGDVTRAERAAKSARDAAAEAAEAARVAQASADTEAGNGGCGRNCRDLMDKAAAARDQAAEARRGAAEADSAAQDVAARAAQTQDAARLDDQIAKASRRLDDTARIADPRAQGKLLATFFGQPESAAARMQQWFDIGSAMFMEFIALAALLSAETLASHALRPTEAGTAPRRAAPAGPRLVVDNARVGDVAAILSEIVEAAPGARLSLPDAGRAYARVCEQRGIKALAAKDAGPKMVEELRGRGFKMDGATVIGAKLRA